MCKAHLILYQSLTHSFRSTLPDVCLKPFKKKGLNFRVSQYCREPGGKMQLFYFIFKLIGKLMYLRIIKPAKSMLMIFSNRIITNGLEFEQDRTGFFPQLPGRSLISCFAAFDMACRHFPAVPVLMPYKYPLIPVPCAENHIAKIRIGHGFRFNELNRNHWLPSKVL